MSLRDIAITAVAVFIALAGLFAAVSFFTVHSQEGQSSTVAATIANEVADVVEISMPCTASATIGSNGSTWTQDGAQVVSQAQSGELQLKVTSGKESFPIALPVFSGCTKSGQQLTASGAQ